jgi:hypothetical protein
VRTLRQYGKEESAEAEKCFRSTIEIARRQSATSWELRATTSLGRLLLDANRRDEVHAMLAQIHNWFTEGFDTAEPERREDAVCRGDGEGSSHLTRIIFDKPRGLRRIRARVCGDRNWANPDSFAYRRPDLLQTLDVYEVDHPASQVWKRERIKELGIKIPTRLRYVPIDFERETLSEGLAAAELNLNAATFFSWLGVTQYLTSEAVLSTLQQIGQTAAPGARVGQLVEK